MATALTSTDEAGVLGIIDGAAQRTACLAELDSAASIPRALLVVVSRGETPARAERRFLADLSARAEDRLVVGLDLPPSLSLTGETRDADRLEQRTRLWRDAAHAVGISDDRVLELDLARSSPAQAASLNRALGPAQDQLVQSDHDPAAPPIGVSASFIRSCDLILAWSRRPHDDPRIALTDLIGEIRRAYGSAGSASRLALLPTSFDDAERSMRAAAARVARVLPDWAPRNPRLMAAVSLTLTAGTLAGIAAVGGPIGVAAGFWPLYAAAGATVGEILGRQATAITSADTEHAPELPRLGDHARAAILESVMLEHDALPDADVARVLDRVMTALPNTHDIEHMLHSAKEALR